MVGTYLKHLNEMLPVSNITNIFSGKLGKFKEKFLYRPKESIYGFL